MKEKMTKEITMEEFRKTGMLLYVNQIMQPFGLSIAISENKLIAQRKY